MKTKNMIWAALSMTAALVMTACTNDDNIVETPAAPQAEVKTIPYSVTVSQGGDATTRATVDSDNKTLRFATGDKLYIESNDRTDLKGILTLKSGDVGKTSGATFEGTISYTGDAPADNIWIMATLVGTSNENFNFDGDKVDGFKKSSAYYDDVKEAVEKYSYLTGMSTYGEKNFTLSQYAAFLNFEITFEDGTAAGTTLTTVVNNDNGATNLCTADVTTTTEGGKVVAKFVLPTYKGLTLSGATVTMGDKGALAINNATLEGKVYNVKRKTNVLSGVFSVSSTKKVKFSKGNLRYASGTWSFFDNQYDYYNSYSADACDHFGWSTSATTYGMNTSTSSSTYSGDFVDWGATMGTGWFTLTKDEWTYLFNTRTVNGGTGSGKSYTLGQSVNGKLGVVIYPDNYTGEVYSGSDWATFESVGCVFLPAAGGRNGSEVSSAGTWGEYWSATPVDADVAYCMYFGSGNLNPASYYFGRANGFSVRLVRQVE